MTFSKIPILLLSMGLLILSACSQQPKNDNNRQQQPTAKKNTIVVHTTLSKNDVKKLAMISKDFTKNTGIHVRFVNMTQDNLLASLNKAGKQSIVDVLLADLALLWQAESLNLIQPVMSEVLINNIPKHHRHPTNKWFGIGTRPLAIAYRDDHSASSSYAALAEKRWQGKLCMTQKQLASNQTLVTSLLVYYGTEKTTNILAGWQHNLAQPPFQDDKDVMLALKSGRCGIGIISVDSYSKQIAPLATFEKIVSEKIEKNSDKIDIKQKTTKKKEKRKKTKKSKKQKHHKQKKEPASVRLSALKPRQNIRNMTEKVSFANTYPVKISWPNQKSTGTHLNVIATSVTRYSPNPLKSLRFLEWLSSREIQLRFAKVTHSYPIREDVEIPALLVASKLFIPQQEVNAIQEKHTQALHLLDLKSP